MTITIHNASAHPFTGWVRTTTDAHVMPLSGVIGVDTVFRLGSPNGLRTTSIDLSVRDLMAGEIRNFPDPEHADGNLTPPPPLPEMLIWHLTIPGSIEVPSSQTDPIADGACWITKHRHRHGMFVVDTWLRRYPDEPWMAHGVARVTCSDISRPDLTAVAPEIMLHMGDGWVCHVFGKGPQAPLVTVGETWGDGMTRSPLYFTMVDVPRVPPDRINSTQSIAERFITARGVDKVYPEGNGLRMP